MLTSSPNVPARSLAVRKTGAKTVVKKAQKAPARSLRFEERDDEDKTVVETTQKAPARSRSLWNIFGALRTIRAE